ncbi:unnamed protein product [Trichogramma brassicae]|uniref:Uncharacterized protein n=1 Tax=Trichogramma brassicae TaxID=86971 RepID=A0A6H5HZU3_9HYME|nr:unnamed protein product [Trichogramma brassicae]
MAGAMGPVDKRPLDVQAHPEHQRVGREETWRMFLSKIIIFIRILILKIPWTTRRKIANFRGSFSRLVWSSLCPRWSGYHSKIRPGLCHQPPKRLKKKTPITVRAGSDRITISRSPRRGLTRLAIDGAQHSQDEVRSESHTHKRAPDAGA